MVRRTKEEALITRDRILDAAEQTFSIRGVSRTSLGDIALAAGVTRGAIYWHFRDKSELFCAMIGRVTLPMEAQHQQAEERFAADPLGYIRWFSLNILERTEKDEQCRRVFDIIIHKCEYLDEMAEVKRRFSKMREGCTARIQKAFAAARTLGMIRASADAGTAAAGLQVLIDGLITNWLAERRGSLLRTGRAVIGMYLDGLTVAPRVPARRGVSAAVTRAVRVKVTTGARVAAR